MLSYDFHCHILPSMDDGAQDVKESLQLIKSQVEQGIEHIIFTPHFYARKESAKSFLARRKEAIEELQREEVNQLEKVRRTSFRLGAEVKISSSLWKEDLRPFCIEGTDYILLELPFQQFPAELHSMLDKMEYQGLLPILAHVERYQYFREDANLLYKLACRGVVSQINADSLLDKHDQGFSKACLKNGLAHMVVSDCHSVSTRPCNVMEAMGTLDKKLQQIIAEYAKAVWENEVLFFDVGACPKKGLFGYR